MTKEYHECTIYPGLVNDNMFKLHSAGTAQAYYVYGELEMYRNF